jgi:hypothetical protein
VFQRLYDFTSNICCKRCSADALFGGIVYLHDITQDRAVTYGPSWPVGYLSRPEPARHLLLTTVKWDRAVSGPDYAERENELRRGVWKGIGEGGAKICRFSNTKSSAWDVINTLLELQPLELQVLQKELDRIRRATSKPTPPMQRKGIFARLFGFLFNVRCSPVVVDRLTESSPRSTNERLNDIRISLRSIISRALWTSTKTKRWGISRTGGPMFHSPTICKRLRSHSSNF